MTYDGQILSILAEAGQRGISIRSIAKHVYNMNCTLFYKPDFEEIGEYVRLYLRRVASRKHPVVENAGRRGYYRLNVKGSEYARQLMLDFAEQQDNAEEKQPAAPQQDLSLDLFADF